MRYITIRKTSFSNMEKALASKPIIFRNDLNKNKIVIAHLRLSYLPTDIWMVHLYFNVKNK